MNVFAKLIVSGFALMTLNGCAMVQGGSAAAMGGLYSEYKTPGAVGNGPSVKTGEACASSILGWVATGDASLKAAMTAGGIAEISYVDHNNFAVLGIYAKTCTVVSGR
jgi:hypothetical protein